MTVRIEYRKLSSGVISPRLIISNAGKRVTERINIKIYPNDPERKEKIKACEAIKSRKEFQLFSKADNVTIKLNISLYDLASEYVDSINIAGTRKYVATLNHIKDTIGYISINHLSKSDCQSFYDHLINSLSPQTCHSYYACLTRILNYAIDSGLISRNPANGIRKLPKTNITQKNILLFDEFQTMVKDPPQNKEVFVACILSYYSGIGLSEIRKLTPDNIQGSYLHYTRGKTKIPVRVELKSFVLDMLDLPFRNLPTNEAINKSLFKWTKRTGINKHITFYCFRHSFAVNLLLNDVNIKLVKELMGHTSLKHTLNYLYFVDLIRERPTMKLPDLDL